MPWPFSYAYDPLPEDSIRLLRILPDPDEYSPIRCQLFQCALLNSGKTHLYEALSYVWGSQDAKKSIILHDRKFSVGNNLHAALSHLRDGFVERIIWIDAICINQQDRAEKGHQVQSMAKIFAKANCVIVWLGEVGGNTDQALKDLLRAARALDEDRSPPKDIKKPGIFELLQRPWFERIWVLQEVAAARRILIKCGSAEIDGQVFCSGLAALKLSYQGKSTSLAALVSSATYLMRGAAFRPRCINDWSGRFSLDIRPLAELVELHHSRKATERHDKIYALLGMAHGMKDAHLPVDYELPWSKLFQNFVKAITSKDLQVDTWDDKETAIIQGLGHALGEVTEVERDAASTKLKIQWRSDLIEAFELGINSKRADWTLPFAAAPIRHGDVVCLLQGTSRPTIIRPYKDYWAVIRISVTATDNVAMAIPTVVWPMDQATHLLLVWDWDMYRKELQLEDYYESYKKRRGLECPNAEREDFMDRAIRLQNLGLGLEDAERHEDGNKRIRTMLHEIDKELEIIISPESTGDGDTAGQGDATKLRETFHLLSKSRWPTLVISAENGYARVVKLLLDYDEVDPNRDNFDGNNPLLSAVINGHEAIVKLLLKSSRVDPNATNLDGGSQFYGETPVWRAAFEGHKSIFTALINSGRLNIGGQQKQGGSPLMYAAKRGHEDIVKLLLETCKVDPDAVGECGTTALSWAAESGQEAIVKILLDTGRVDPDGKDNFRCTPLFKAASNGHYGVAELLLSNSQVNPDARTKDGKTPLWIAAANGHEAVVRLLLSTGRVNVNARLTDHGHDGRTPLWAAACQGHTVVVELLLKEPEIDRNLAGRDIAGFQRIRDRPVKLKLLSPLQIARKEERWEVVELLKP